MIRSLWSAASGMLAQQLNVDTISNNLANVNTAGFKKSRVEFQELFYETIRAAGATNTAGSRAPSGIQVGHGVRPVATQRLFSPGNLQKTENHLDVAPQGDGFFMIQTGAGKTAYTRDGAFRLDKDGKLVNSQGYSVLTQSGGQITIGNDAAEISIGVDGTISVLKAGSSAPANVGQIGLAKFLNPAGLNAMGGNVFEESNSSGPPQKGSPGTNGYGNVVQGFLEMSNVVVVEEMVSLIMAQRAYEISSKAIQSSDEMLQNANNLRR